eukprot:GILJ01007220.1.p1 GENE.GILJ01007220.1~~GILJ01007220.1.p1  ORF type:complete len:929 (-),score=167.37 GILJ01007220.1:53-2839(-)
MKKALSMFNKDEKVPVLPLSNRVLFPGTALRIQIGRSKSISLVQALESKLKSGGADLRSVSFIAVFSTKNPPKDDYGPNDLYPVGTLARILEISVKGDGREGYSLVVEGAFRIEIKEVIQIRPFMSAVVSKVKDVESVSQIRTVALGMSLKTAAKELVSAMSTDSPVVPRVKMLLDLITDSGVLADVLCANLDVTFEEKQEVLEILKTEERAEKVLELIKRQIEVLKISKKINSSVQNELSKSQREFFLKQQMRAIREELGDPTNEVDDLETRLKTSNLPEPIIKVVDRELRRLRGMQPSHAEYTVARTYLEWIADLPWTKSTVDRIELDKARWQLANDHYGLETVKKRILEYLAVRKLKQDLKGPILCLQGPPGVGKTSLGRSIASALNRQFHRISLGGVRDESEIRGHRRTYIGALPGVIVQGLKRVGSNNPVILLDEIDKLGRDMRGDPASALLEVLDPEQNSTFVDHYLAVPFDLSKVLFIATANELSTIPAALRDRMEIINIPGYTAEEKLRIAKTHLIPKQIREHGISTTSISIPDETVIHIIVRYTREAGVRNLERSIASLCRSVAVKYVTWAEEEEMLKRSSVDQNLNQNSNNTKHIMYDSTALKTGVVVPTDNNGNGNGNGDLSSAVNISTVNISTVNDQGSVSYEGDASEPQTPPNLTTVSLPAKPFLSITITPDQLAKILGPEKYEPELIDRTNVPGIATGLAWTQAGGDVLFIEATWMDGKGNLQLTGQLGDVMKESAQTALSWIRSHAYELGLLKRNEEKHFLEMKDIHIHFPAGAVPKDGPSAGVTITSALVSLMTGRRVRFDTAMTGEISLRGLVLPVGGVKEKCLAAYTAGIKRIILPYRCAKDIVEIPSEIKDQIQFIFVKRIEEVLQAALEGGYTFDRFNINGQLSKDKMSDTDASDRHPHNIVQLKSKL